MKEDFKLYLFFNSIMCLLNISSIVTLVASYTIALNLMSMTKITF